MKYIETVPLTVHLYPKQREIIEKLQYEIKKEYQVKLPLTELVRIGLERGLPLLLEDTNFILERIGWPARD